MKRYASVIIAASAALIAIISLCEAHRMKIELSGLMMDYNSQLGDISHAIEDVYADIDGKLAAEASLIADSGYSFGKIDPKKRTIRLSYYVVAKEYSEKTSAAVVIGGREYPMRLKSGRFNASLEIPVFGETWAQSIYFKENGAVRSEKLGDCFTPRYFLPEIDAHFNGEFGSEVRTKGTDGFKVTYDGSFEIYISQKDSVNKNKIEKLYFSEYIDGRQISKTPVPLNVKADSSYSSADKDENSAQAPVSVYVPGDGQESDCQYGFAVKKEVSVAGGSVYEAYFEAEDSLGFFYRTAFDTEADILNAPLLKTGVFDKSGKLLWQE